MTESTPRINAAYLQQFSHQTVRILGKVKQLRGEQATIQDANNDNINLHLNREANLQVQHAVEIIGKVQNDLSVKVMASTDMGPESNIDFSAVEAVVDATHRYHEIFYSKEQ
ncbi:replication factor A protein 3 [Teratosphaeria nubilosa]|uniref:Replication factor A protein 3 n=1 Tax=Teratosphaeria nubilosa TaxID=161662 RepID=A0A6G1LJT1_9PEZI|nr:replication factor A protein 3 [Teratosphaeria nubilosa]